MFLKGFEGWHILIIAGLFVVLFGARKLPDSARSIGQSLRIFKSEMKAAGQDEHTQHDAAGKPDQPANAQPKALEQSTAAMAAMAANSDAATHTTAMHLTGQDALQFDNARP